MRKRLRMALFATKFVLNHCGLDEIHCYERSLPLYTFAIAQADNGGLLLRVW
jgi:hypothetical protein